VRSVREELPSKATAAHRKVKCQECFEISYKSLNRQDETKPDSYAETGDAVSTVGIKVDIKQEGIGCQRFESESRTVGIATMG